MKGVEKWEVEKILNKRKVRKVVRWKGFIVKHNSWKKKKDLENAKKVITEFERRINAEVRRQEKLEMVEEKNFKREKLLEKYMVKMLYK